MLKTKDVKMKNKKILMIATTDNMIWQFLIPHIKHLEELGNTVECVCAKTGFWFDELREKFGFTMHEMNFARNPITPKNLKSYKQLVKLQKERNYNLIYCQQPVGGLMGRLLARKFKIPCIYTAHGFHFYKGCPLKNKLIYKTVEKWLSKYTDALITINEEDYETAKKMKAKRVYKINGIGIDENKYEKNKETKASLRESFNLKNDDFVIATVAEFIKRKNYKTMLEAIRLLKNKHSNIKFLVCGRGQEEEKIKKQIKKLDIEQEVVLLGYRKDVNRILQCSDVFMLASFHEGLTLSIIEAMSFELPCVVSNVRGNRDLIQDGKGGFVVEPSDAKTFAEKINEILENPNLAQEFGKYNKQQSEKYKVEIVKNDLEEIYKLF